jgi:pimeloyl-ACP methyl ester carboxylesterase
MGCTIEDHTCNEIVPYFKVFNKRLDTKPPFAFFQGFGVCDRHYPSLDKFCSLLANNGFPTYVFFSQGAFGNKGHVGYVNEELSRQKIERGLSVIAGDGHEKIICCGHSFGATEVVRYLDLDFKKSNSNLDVRGLVLIAPYTCFEDTFGNHPFGRALYSACADILPTWLNQLPGLHPFAHPKYHYANPSYDFDVGAKRLVRAGSAKFFKTLRLEDHLPKLDLPILFLLAKSDRICSSIKPEELAVCLRDCGKNVKTKFAQTQLVNEIGLDTEYIFNFDLGHNLMREAPKDCVDNIIDWYNSRVKK